MPIKQTPYGTVDAKAFKRLRGSFETMKVLYGVASRNGKYRTLRALFDLIGP